MRRVLSALPAAAVAALALAAAPAQVRLALDRLGESARGIARDEEAARRELRGDAYAAALARAAQRIPAGGAYALGDEGSRGPDTNWLRCDLAPRVPVLLRPERCGAWSFEVRRTEGPDVAVVVAKDGGIRIAETRALLEPLWSGLTGPQEDVPGWLDEPAEGRAVSGRFDVAGWCQERGGRPCPAVRVWLDGTEVDAARVERIPRPELRIAIPEMGDCSRAGWRVVVEPGSLAPGSHCVAAALIAGGGRHRRVGPWTFTVTK